MSHNSETPKKKTESDTKLEVQITKIRENRAILIAIIGLLSAVAGFYFNYLITRTQIELPISATETSAAKATLFTAIPATAITLSTSDSDALNSSTQTSNNESNISVPIAINSTKDWQSTGVHVEKGDTVRVRVVGGKWTALREKLPSDIQDDLPDPYNSMEVWAYYNTENTGTGVSGGYTCIEYGVPECPVPTEQVGVLVAKIGLSQAFAVGSSKTFTVPVNGILYLRINDGQREGTANLDDNAGVLAVEVIVNK